MKTFLTLSLLLITSLSSLCQTTQPPLSSYDLSFEPIVYDGISGVFVPTPLDSKIRYELTWSINLAKETKTLYKKSWALEVQRDALRDLVRIEREKNRDLQEKFKRMAEARAMDRAVINSYEEAHSTLMRENRLLKWVAILSSTGLIATTTYMAFTR